MRNADALLVTPVLLIGLGFLGACSGAADARVTDGSSGGSASASSETNPFGNASTPSSATAPSLTPAAAQSAYSGALNTVSGAVGNDVNSGPACARPVAADPLAQLCDVLGQIQGKSHPFFFAGVRNDVTIPFDETEVSVDVVFDLTNLQAASFLRTSTSLDDNVLASGSTEPGASLGASAKGQGYLGFAFGASADASLSSAWSSTFAAQETASAQAASFFSYDAEATAFCDPTQSLCGSSANANVCLNLDIDVSLPTLVLSAALPGLPWDAVTAQIAAHAHAQADASASASGTVGVAQDGGTSTVTATGTGAGAADASAGASASVSFRPSLVTMTDSTGSSFVQFAGGASLAYSLADSIGSSGSDAWFAAAIAIALDVQKQSGLSYAQLCGGDAGADVDAGTSSPSSSSTPIVVR
jgi:hypothetical protein